MRYDMVNPDVSLKSEVGISREARCLLFTTQE